jgi:DNA repair exonuclease SbcCD ATPase subunit
MTPLFLKLENFFSHKESEIDFTQFNSALLIGNVEGDYDVSNGCGKSAIFEGLLWCLFNKSRAAAMNDIIMWGENECMVTMTFSHDLETYRIRRLRSRVSSTSTVAFDIQDECGEWMDISRSTSKLTNEEIMKRIKFDYKTFINSAYFRQNDISEFAESDPGRRKEILKSIIDISKWDEYEVETKSKLRVAKGEAKVLEALCKDYDKLVEDLVEYEELYEEAAVAAKQDSKERSDVEKKVDKFAKAYSKMKENLDTDQWDKVSGDIDRLKRKLADKNIKAKDLARKVAKFEQEVAGLERRESDIQRQADSIILVDNAEKLLEELRKEVTTHKAESSSARDRLSDLKNTHILDGECHVCGSVVDADVHARLVSEHEDAVTLYRRKKVFADNKLRELTVRSETYEKSLRDKRKKDSLLNTIKNVLMQGKIAKEHLIAISEQHEEAVGSVEKNRESIVTNERILASLRSDDFNNLRKQIEELRIRKTALDASLAKVNMSVGIYQEKVATCKVKIKEMEESKVELSIKRDRIDVLTKLYKIFGKNGIQTILLNAVIRDLENTCNKILNSICTDHFEIIIETQRVGSDGVTMVDTLDLRVKKDGVVQHFKSLSGGEKFRVSLAIRIALSEISSRHGGSALEFLLLDEINSPLDRHGIETLFINVIKSLEDRYKIMVITHDDTLKERFDSIIDVTKSSGESTVNFITR